MLGDLQIDAGHDAVEKLDHDHLGAEPPPHRAELEPDHARADDQQPLRNARKNERARGRDDAFLVDGHALERRHVRAGGDDDVFRLDGLRRAVRGLYLDLAPGEDAGHALKRVDLVPLEQEGDALDVAVDALVLEPHHAGKIELRRPDLDAHAGEGVGGLLVKFGGMQQRLGGNAPDIETGAAEGRALLDERGLEAELRRANGAHIAAGSGADDNQIIMLSHDDP